ncbi:MAG TPA: MOSC domain-containing protein [Acidimicrobiales bacterium]|nr:MOSC domain-containing protein [Acidimicrobiales bacterium]
MIALGPHRFSTHDAEATVGHGPLLVDLLTDGLPEGAVDGATATTLAGHRAAVVGVVEDEGAPLEERLAAVWDRWRAAAAALRASGALGPAAEGTVAHLATSDGGVPKASVDRVEVTWGGVVGDRQAKREHHGRPWQALCLWSTEVIDGFVAAGDRLAPGRAGENVTVTGLPWDRVRPGALLTLGAVTCEVWAWSLPCRNNAQWFADGRFDRMHHSRGPVSRVYAAVVEPGAIAVGDRVVLAGP